MIIAELLPESCFWVKLMLFRVSLSGCWSRAVLRLVWPIRAPLEKEVLKHQQRGEFTPSRGSYQLLSALLLGSIRSKKHCYWWLSPFLTNLISFWLENRLQFCSYSLLGLLRYWIPSGGWFVVPRAARAWGGCAIPSDDPTGIPCKSSLVLYWGNSGWPSSRL